MSDFPIQDIDNIKYPKRRPWVILMVVVAVGAFLFWRQVHPTDKERASVAEPSPVPVKAVQKLQASSVVPQSGEGVGTSLATPAGADERRPYISAPAPSATTPTAQTAPMSAPEVGRLLQQARAAQARAAQDSSAAAEARRFYLDALKQNLDAATRTDVETHLGKLNVELATTPLPLPGVKVDYVVKSGDSLDKIARKLGTTTTLIARSNQIANPSRIKAGDRFSILAGKFAMTVSKGRKDLLVTLDNAFFKRYFIATGKFGKTPLGTFVVVDKIVEPVWWRPDGKEVPFGNPENILGTRWMAIRATGTTPDVRGYGIHGTWDDASIGTEASAGCVRMHNPDVEELFDIVPMDTSVTITE